MRTRSITEGLERLPFFEGMSHEHLDFVAGCAAHVRAPAGRMILKQGRLADRFYLIRSGEIMLEMPNAARRLSIITIGDGDMLGWSWLLPPYTWHYDAVALTPVALVGFDAACVRKRCDTDPAFGYEMYRRFTQLIVDRLMSTRLQLADVYR